jgi:predicted DNA-binding WGR domain protein
MPSEQTEGTVQAAGWELTYVNPTVNADKFYRLFVVGSAVVAHYGRSGARQGQTKVYDRGTPAAARAFARQQTIAKLAKGYTQPEAARLFTARLTDVSAANGPALTAAWRQGTEVTR